MQLQTLAHKTTQTIQQEAPITSNMKKKMEYERLILFQNFTI